MIRKATEGDVNNILKLLSGVLPHSILLKISESTLVENLREKRQISYVAVQKDEVLAHASVFCLQGIGTLGNFATVPTLRKLGVMGEIISKLERECSSLPLTHLCGYAVLGHDVSQKLLDETYLPIGVTLSDANPLHPEDELYLPSMFNGELVLCKPVSSKTTLRVPPLFGYEDQVAELYKKLNVYLCKEIKRTLGVSNIPEYIEVNLCEDNAGAIVKKAYDEGYKFLGVYPNGRFGIGTIGFASKSLLKRCPPNFLANNPAREAFVYELLNSI